MQVRLHLWKDERLVRSHSEPDEPKAIWTMDLWLTEVHQGRHGTGEFEIEAFWADRHLLFQRQLVRLRGIIFPPPPR